MKKKMLFREMMMRTRINGRMHLTVMMKKLKRVQSLAKAKVKERIKRFGMKAKNH